MLNHSGAGDRELAGQFAGGHGHARKALENNDADRVTEQGERAQDGPKVGGGSMGSGHGLVSGWADTFGKRNRA